MIALIAGGLFIIAIFSAIKPQLSPAINITSTPSASPTIDVGATGTAIWYDENPLALSPSEATETAIWYIKHPQAGATETAAYYKKYYPSMTILPTDTPGPPTATPTITATFIPRGSNPPDACTFPLAQTTSIESTPLKYTFSQPRVVLADHITAARFDEIENAKKNIRTSIIDWLPDNQNILIRRSTLIDLGRNGYQNTIERFNPETKEIQIYAKYMQADDSRVVWNRALNAVIYQTRKLDFNGTDTTRQLMLSDGNLNGTEVIADNLPLLFDFAINFDGSQTAYLLGNQLIKLDSGLKALHPIAFDSARWDYLNKDTDRFLPSYEMAWRPNASQIFLHAHANYNASYTYLLDADTGQLCNLHFGEWINSARWSPNGRYLAVIRGHGFWTGPDSTTDVAVLDTLTGNLYTLGLPKKTTGKNYVGEIVWTPDNRHLLIYNGFVSYRKSDENSSQLFLSDFISGKMDPVLPSYHFSYDAGNLVWSPDGSKLLMNCSTLETSQLCLISVHKTKQ